ncbi:DUF3536 domain-containing protein [bacterium]|nr:DUF3536 domain-containing protein [bacterium]
MNRHITIHGHFYQPPRENPWLEEVELQDSAHPYHDWNSRITAECYEPNTASRILDNERRIIDIVNNYSKISFNFGPTLLSWMQRHDPETYGAILEADRESRDRFSGHGSAIAQSYNHIIMPLANSRDKRTQVIWGIRDFEHRFGRKPEGMWLSETAVDLETLDLLAEYGVLFTILAPHQAGKIRKIGDKEWIDVAGGKVDPKMPYRCTLPSGRTIALFFYDGPISQDIAFQGLLSSGEHLANRLVSAFVDNGNGDQLVHIATDGETYGHHHRYGDMALAFCLYHLEAADLAHITVYGEHLEEHPPEYEATIIEDSSWSCAHGVERWRNDCGCCTGGHPGWRQHWRAPLRGALDWLRDNLAQVYEENMAGLADDPWRARDDYIDVILNRSDKAIDSFLATHAGRTLSDGDARRALELLEMQRHAMLMYTSCGWFFDELSGIETVQIIQYAARAMQLAQAVSGIDLEEAFIGLLERAPGNVPAYKNGAEIYRLFVKPTILDLRRVAVHYAVSSLFKEHEEDDHLYTYTLEGKTYDRQEVGRQKLAVGRVSVRSDITREEETISFAALHLGDHNIVGGAKAYTDEASHEAMRAEISDAFGRSAISETIRLIDKHFTDHSYSLWHLFRDEQRAILDLLLDESLREVETSITQIYERQYPVMKAIEGMRMTLPRYFSMVLEFVLNKDIRTALEREEIDVDELNELVVKARRWPVQIDKPTLNFIASRRLNDLTRMWSEYKNDTEPLETLTGALKAFSGLSLEPDIWKAQIVYFRIGKQLIAERRAEAESGDDSARRWVRLFEEVGDFLRVRVD